MREKKILYNYIAYFLSFLLLIIIGISNVFADTYTNIGYLSDKTQVQVSVTYATESGAPLTVNKDQVYNIPGISDLIITVNNYSFSANVIYEIEINLPFSTINSNMNSVSVVGGTNSGCSYISSRSLDGHYPRVRFSCTNASNGLTVVLSNSNHQNIITSTSSSQTGGSDFRWNYTYLILVNVSQDTTVIEQNSQIINQNNQIIQGQQDIINNQNQNTQAIIDSNKVCKDYDSGSIDSNYGAGFLNSSGNYYTTGNTAGYGVSKYIDINNSTVTVLLSGMSSTYTCFYNVDKTKISCINGSDLVENSELTVPTGSYYIRTSIQKFSNRPTLRVCKNGSQALDDSINNLDDTINDDDTSGAESEASEFFSSFDTETFGLTSIITAPLNLIQSLLSSTCSDLQLPLPYLNNKYLTLPCMTTIYTQHFGTFFTIYQTITYGIIAYWVCVRIFNQVKDFKNPEHDEIEVMDL